MYLAEGLQQKWGPVLDHPDMPKIKDPYRKAVTAVLLENQEKAMAEQHAAEGHGPLTEAATSLTSLAPTASSSGGVQYQDPVLISMIRRAMPNLVAYDVCGVQPMTGPTGLIFAMRPRYDSQGGAEAMYNEPNTTHAGDAGDDMVSTGAGATAPERLHQTRPASPDFVSFVSFVCIKHASTWHRRGAKMKKTPTRTITGAAAQFCHS